MLIEHQKFAKFIRLFLILSFIACWISVSTSFDDLLFFKKSNNFNYSELINFTRHISIYIFLIFTIIVSVFFKEKIFIKKFLFFYFLILYFISQLFGLLFTDNSIKNISFIISAITSIFTIILIDVFFLQNERKKFLLISLIILTTVFCITFIPKLVMFLKGDAYLYGYYPSEIFIDKNLPRSSGLSRSALIILILIEFFEFNLYKKNTYKLFLIKVVLLSSILLLQSRTIIFLTLITYIFIFLNNKKLNFIKFSTIYFLIPICLFFSFTSIHAYQKIKKDFSDREITLKDDFDIIQDYNYLRTFPNKNFSSGRIEDWKQILYKIDGNNVIYGFGAQGDRYLINQSA